MRWRSWRDREGRITRWAHWDMESPPTVATVAEAYTYQSAPSMGAEVGLADGGHATRNSLRQLRNL